MINKEPSELAMQIAKRLTTLRLHKTWTRETLANQAGINVYTLKHFERTGQISLERLIAVCEALDIIDEFERIFKPRQRINVDNWEVESQPQRQRGRRRTTNTEQETETV